MTTVAHSALTGSDLHEPKGAAAATIGKVYVSDGAGSGAWTAIAGYNPLANALLHVRDQVTANTAPQTLTTITWNTVRLQTTTTNQITSASLASNQIFLPAGTYWAQGYAGAFSVLSSSTFASRLRIRNITAGSTLVVGRGISVSTSDHFNGVTCPSVVGRFTLSGTTTIELQHYTSTGATGGVAANAVEDEVYTDFLIWKL